MRSPLRSLALEDAIQADVIITEAVVAGRTVIRAEKHPLGATVHRRKLTNLITWPFTGRVPAPLRELARTRSRRGPVPEHPMLTGEEKSRFSNIFWSPPTPISIMTCRVVRRSTCSALIHGSVRSIGCAPSSFVPYMVREQTLISCPGLPSDLPLLLSPPQENANHCEHLSGRLMI